MFDVRCPHTFDHVVYLDLCLSDIAV
uniref:Uncharacterized protein n=1 Tax=Anguilla anguilla TaxID=7936 RepID=A0A0E9QLP7_ANGAN